MKKVLSLLLVFAMVFTTVAISGAEDVAAYADLSGVSAVSDKAYKITDAAGLNKLAELVNGGSDFSGVTVYLANDIVLNEGVLDAEFNFIGTSATAFSPIGNVSDGAFAGTFDGQGHTIKGLYINVAEKKKGIGLFGQTNGATIKNLALTDAYITVDKSQEASDLSRIGGIVGLATATTVENCYVSGFINGPYIGDEGTTFYGSEYMGGIMGRTDDGATVIKNCMFNGKVSCAYSTAAGILGRGIATIENCYAQGAVDAGSGAAAILSADKGSTVTNCYFLDSTSEDSFGTPVTADEAKTLAAKLGDAFKDGASAPILAWMTEGDTPVAPVTPGTPATGFDYEDKANVLKTMGLMVGDESGNLMLDKQLTRLEGIALYFAVTGQTANAEALTDEETETILAAYTDKDQIIWGRKFVAYAIKTGVSVGVSTTEWGPSAPLQGRMLAKWIANFIGRTDVAYETALTTLAEAFAADNAAELNRDHAAGIMASMLALENKNTGKTVIADLYNSFVAADKTEYAAAAVKAAADLGIALTAGALTPTAKQTNTKEITVSFDGVASNANIALKLGAVVISATTTWNETKTEAVIAPSVALIGGKEYTVEISGVDVKANNLKVVAAAAKAGSLVIDTTAQITKTAVKGGADGEGYFGFKVFDQFGNEMKASTYLPANIYLYVQGAKTVTRGTGANADKINFTFAYGDIKADTAFTYSIVDSALATTTYTGEITPYAVREVASVVFGEAVGTLQDGEPLVEKNSKGQQIFAFYVPVTVYDQYNEVMKASSALVDVLNGTSASEAKLDSITLSGDYSPYVTLLTKADNAVAEDTLAVVLQGKAATVVPVEVTDISKWSCDGTHITNYVPDTLLDSMALTIHDGRYEYRFYYAFSGQYTTAKLSFDVYVPDASPITSQITSITIDGAGILGLTSLNPGWNHIETAAIGVADGSFKFTFNGGRQNGAETIIFKNFKVSGGAPAYVVPGIQSGDILSMKAGTYEAKFLCKLGTPSILATPAFEVLEANKIVSMTFDVSPLDALCEGENDDGEFLLKFTAVDQTGKEYKEITPAQFATFFKSSTLSSFTPYLSRSSSFSYVRVYTQDTLNGTPINTLPAGQHTFTLVDASNNVATYTFTSNEAQQITQISAHPGVSALIDTPFVLSSSESGEIDGTIKNFEGVELLTQTGDYYDSSRYSRSAVTNAIGYKSDAYDVDFTSNVYTFSDKDTKEVLFTIDKNTSKEIKFTGSKAGSYKVTAFVETSEYGILNEVEFTVDILSLTKLESIAIEGADVVNGSGNYGSKAAADYAQKYTVYGYIGDTKYDLSDVAGAMVSFSAATPSGSNMSGFKSAGVEGSIELAGASAKSSDSKTVVVASFNNGSKVLTATKTVTLSKAVPTMTTVSAGKNTTSSSVSVSGLTGTVSSSHAAASYFNGRSIWGGSSVTLTEVSLKVVDQYGVEYYGAKPIVFAVNYAFTSTVDCTIAIDADGVLTYSGTDASKAVLKKLDVTAVWADGTSKVLTIVKE